MVKIFFTISTYASGATTTSQRQSTEVLQKMRRRNYAEGLAELFEFPIDHVRHFVG